MGACFSKIFNGCPLRVHCTASWIHPETRDQHLLIGAEEGIFQLNMNELHDSAIDQIYARRTTWLYVIKDVLMSLSGKSSQLYRHDLLALHSKQQAAGHHRFSLHMNRIPERLVPRKFALTTKVPDTKGCAQCCVARNPYNGYKYLCGALPSGIFLMQWYDPLNKFMLLKQCEWPTAAVAAQAMAALMQVPSATASSAAAGNHALVGQQQHGNGFGHGLQASASAASVMAQQTAAAQKCVFQMIITPELEYPIVCTGVKRGVAPGTVKLDMINMNSGEWFTDQTASGPLSM